MPRASNSAALTVAARSAVSASGRVGDLHVVGLVLGHQLITADAVQHGVHDRPLRRRGVEAPLGLLGGQVGDVAATEVDVQPAVLDVHPRPHDLARAWSSPHSVPPPSGKYIFGCRLLYERS